VAIALMQEPDWDVVGACNAEEALRVAQQRPPHLVLLDWMMPKVDGAGALTLFRSRPETKSVPIVVMTALGASERAAFKARGVADVISKPFDPLTLSVCLRRILERHDREERWAVPSPGGATPSD